MMKKELIKATQISTNTMKLGKKEVSIGVLAKICAILDCEIDDIVEIVSDK